MCGRVLPAAESNRNNAPVRRNESNPFENVIPVPKKVKPSRVRSPSDAGVQQSEKRPDFSLNTGREDTGDFINSCGEDNILDAQWLR